MRSAILICRPPHATARWQSQAALWASHNGWSCELRTRFDGLLIVAMELDPGQPDVDPADFERQLKEDEVWNEGTELKRIDADQ